MGTHMGLLVLGVLNLQKRFLSLALHPSAISSGVGGGLRIAQPLPSQVMRPLGPVTPRAPAFVAAAITSNGSSPPA